MAGQVYRSWKLAWSIPRSSHNYLVDGLADPLPSVRKKIICQYVKFFQNMSKSVSREVRIMANIFSHDIQSVTGSNLANIENLCSMDPRRHSSGLFKTKVFGYLTPAVDEWRLPFLRKLLAKRSEFFTCEEDTSTIDDLIESLCAS